MSAINCYIPDYALQSFTNYLNDHGIATRPHTSPSVNGIQAFKDGHWMAVVWNKAFKRYTVDSRLKDFVRSFRTVL